MSEFQNGWRSLEMIFSEVLPLIIVSAVVSIADYFKRHYNIEPFRLSKFLVGLFGDIVYGTVVGVAALGLGKSAMLAWALSGCAVHFGIRRLDSLVNQYLDQKYGEKEKK